MPIGLVTSPVESSVGTIKENLEKMYLVTERVRRGLVVNCLGGCGLHQTVVFENLEPIIPEVVIANVIQTVRAYIPVLVYLSSSGHLGCGKQESSVPGARENQRCAECSKSLKCNGTTTENDLII